MLQTKSLGAMSASSRRQSIDGDVLRCPDEVPGPGSYAGVLVLAAGSAGTMRSIKGSAGGAVTAKSSSPSTTPRQPRRPSSYGRRTMRERPSFISLLCVTESHVLCLQSMYRLNRAGFIGVLKCSATETAGFRPEMQLCSVFVLLLF